MKRLIAVGIALCVLAPAPALAGLKERNKIHVLRGKTYVLRRQQMSVEPSGVGCRGIVTRATAVNSKGDMLFRWSQRADWCWRWNRWTEGPRFGAWSSVGNQWWNLWVFRRIVHVRKGGGINADGIRYKYRRTHALFEACWEFCFMDFRVWTAQTPRANGTYKGSKGGT